MDTAVWGVTGSAGGVGGVGGRGAGGVLGSCWGSGRCFWIGMWIIDLGALPALGRILGGQGGGVDLAWRAVGSVGVPVGSCGAWWGLMAVLWAGAEECGRWEAVRVLVACCLLPAAFLNYDFC